MAGLRMQALSIEKNGNAPEFAFTGDQTGEAVTALCPEAILHFCLMEVMKNAVTALVVHAPPSPPYPLY
jgi:hypothetical protein